MEKGHSPHPSSRGTMSIPNPSAHLQLSCFCFPYMLVMNLGHHQNYYNLAQPQRNELEGLSRVLPRTGLSEHICSTQPDHSNYTIDKRGPGSRSGHSCCSGTMGLSLLLGRSILTTEKLSFSWTSTL